VAEPNLVCFTAEVDAELLLDPNDPPENSPSRQRSPPPQYPASEASASSAFRPPPSFSSLFPAHRGQNLDLDHDHHEGNEEDPSAASPAYAPPSDDHHVVESSSSHSASSAAALRFRDETKRALPQDTKGENQCHHPAGEPSRSSSSSSAAKDEEAEPPPAYSEGSSPLQSFTYLMAAAGGAASIITQVQQGGPSLNPLGGTLLLHVINHEVGKC
jgi:G patch domain-containing protein 1